MKFKRRPKRNRANPTGQRDNDQCQVTRCSAESTTILGPLASPIGDEVGVCDRHYAAVLREDP